MLAEDRRFSAPSVRSSFASLPVVTSVLWSADVRIEAVGSAASVTLPDDVRIIDATGLTLMPGLADMHVHFLGGWDGVAVEMLGYQRYLNALLYAGVTTILDTGNVMPYILQIRNEVAAGTIRGPRIYSVGALIDGAEPVWPPISFALSGRAQVPKIVGQLDRAGVDAVKVHVGFSVPLLLEIVREARERSLPVFVDMWTRATAATTSPPPGSPHLSTFPGARSTIGRCATSSRTTSASS